MKTDYPNMVIGQCPSCNKSITECSCKPKPSIKVKEVCAYVALIVALLVYAYVIN